MLAHAWRSLRARPALSALVILSLAAGIAANAILFAVVDAAILRPFPFPDADRLVGVGAAYPRVNRNANLNFFEVFSGPEYHAISERSRTLVGVAGLDLGNEPVLIGDTPERVFTAYLWADAFTALQVTPFAGRGFTATELREGATVAIVSHGFWRTTLNGDPSAVGKVIRVGGRPHEIVGVMPPRVRLYETDLWVPMRDAAATLPQNRRQFNVIARLAPGATVESANAELSNIAQQIAREHGAAHPEYEGYNLGVRPWAAVQVWEFEGVTRLAFAACGLLLVLITANLANLLLARASDRRRDMAVRVALGASRRDLALLVAAEALLLTVAGAAAGLGLAWLGIRAVPSVFGDFLPADAHVALSARLALFVSAVSALTGLLVSIVPAWQLSRTDPSLTLASESGRTAGSPRTRRLQRAVVALQVAIAVIVTGSAAMLAVYVGRVLRVDPGFRHENILSMRLTLPLPRYEGGRSMIFFDELMTRTRALPHVADASVSNQPPPGLFSRARFEIEGRAPAETLPSAFLTTAGPRYRETLGLELARGRWFDERADRGGPREVVITEPAAAQLFPDEDALGKRLRIAAPHSDGTPTEIVGIVRATRNRGLILAPGAEIIASVRQIPDRRQSQLYLVVRGRAGTERILQDVQGIIRGIDPEQPVYAVTTMTSDYRQGGVAMRRAGAVMLAIFAALALGLAGLGIYGVVSHAVGARTREIGLRAALGATRGALARMVVGDAMLPVAAGAAIGLIAMTLGSNTLASWVFGAKPEPMLLVGVTAALMTIALPASMLPARRASRIDPLDALR
jgi:predicted permease